jgi:hypothetical protein
MTTWTYDLSQEANPLLRAGIHGLWRFLRYGKHTLVWSSTATKFSIEFNDPASINDALASVNIENGLVVPPGYIGDTNDERVLATILAHKMLGKLFFAKRGGRRSSTLGESVSVSLWETPFSTEQAPEFVKATYTKHKASEEPLSLDLAKKGAQFAPSQPLGVVFNPAVSQWNKRAVKLDPQSAFALAYSPYAYAATRVGEDSELFALSLDLPSFDEADDAHRMWIEAPLYAASSNEIAAASIQTLLDLPPGTYHVISESLAGAPIYLDGKLKKILSAGLSRNKLASLQSIHVGGVKDAYSEILRNLSLGRAWYVNVNPTYTHNDKPLGKARREAVQHTLNRMIDTMNDPMEKRVIAAFSKIKIAYAGRLRDHFKMAVPDSYDRARKEILDVRLNRVSSRSALLKALTEITNFAGRGFDADELDWILNRTQTHLIEVKALLGLAITTYFNTNLSTNKDD